MKCLQIVLLFFLSSTIQICLSYKILGLIPFSGKSHYINMQPILRELADRGHDVTVITTFEEKDTPPNYKQVIAVRKFVWEFLKNGPDTFALEKFSYREMINFIWDGMFYTNSAVLNSDSIKEFIKNDKTEFDLIFVEIFYQDALYMFTHKYKAPVIGISTNGYNLYAGNFMGNPNILAYMAHEFVKYKNNLSFKERVSNVFAYYYDIYWRKHHLHPKHQILAEEIFGPGPLPQLGDIEKNISLLLINTHFSYDTVRPMVPGIVEIGGVHIKKPKELPKNIKSFLDDAKDGAIFFSFGSNVRPEDMPTEKVNIFLKTFQKLKLKVIWKFEAKNLPGTPSNVMIGNWLPQNDILAHPNIKLFITHGGLLSTQESMYHGVPILGFPFFADQFLNLKTVKDLGFGSTLYFSSLTEEALYETLKELLDNPSYYNKAKEISKRFNDRPMSPMDTAIYWIEYVIRNKGASFLKSPISKLTTIEYYMLDVLAFVFISICLLTFINVKLISCLVNIIFVKWNKKARSDRKEKIK